jgi:CRISPR-associated protein Cas5d
MNPRDQVLEVWGDFACFSRAETKVERFSYPIPTPSAARGIFDSIFSKPSRDPTRAQFRWQVTRIEILKEPRYIALRRNEVKEKMPSPRTIAQWMNGAAEPEPILADADKSITGSDQKGRTQRQTMALAGAHYRIHGQVRPFPGWEDHLQALEGQFRQRAARGKCFQQPYLGCREFPAYFRLIEPHEDVQPPLDWNADLGLMLYDVFDLSQPGTPDSDPSISLFHACVQSGVLEVPEYESPAVFRAMGGEL